MKDREAMGPRLEGRTSHRRWKSMPWLVLMCCLARWCDAQANPPIRRPLAVSANFRYFKDSIGAPLVLTGSQTWNTLQDWGTDGSAAALDFDAFVRFLTAHGQNFTLLWRVEQPKFCHLPVNEGTTPEFTVSPQPWKRTGPGKATDGGLKFDLSKFDQAYFDRLRARTEALNKAGIYAGIYLFTGEFLNLYRCVTDGYPFTGANNINGIDDGYKDGPQGNGSIDMTAANAITRFQDAYVDKVIDTLNDLPNVLWIVSEEAPPSSLWWNDHLIAHLKSYEATKPFQHPAGYAAPIRAPDSVIYNSDADWVAPGATISPISSCGSGKPACKVNVNDSDHSYWEMWLRTPQENRNYLWENVLNGNSVLFMDPYLVFYPRQKRNMCGSPAHGVCSTPDSRYDVFRDNLGYARKYASKLNLGEATPHADLSTTGYCLAHTPDRGAEYLVYAPSGGTFAVDLAAMPASRMLNVEWLNPATGERVVQGTIPAGERAHSFTPPFKGDAVLYLVDTEGHAQ
jgi:hypothetical protein